MTSCPPMASRDRRPELPEALILGRTQLELFQQEALVARALAGQRPDRIHLLHWVGSSGIASRLPAGR